MQDAPQFDKSGFSIEPYCKRVEKPWGYELHWVPADTPYLAKIIHVNAGARTSLQSHDEKQESWLLLSGKGAVIWEDANGEMTQTELLSAAGFNTKTGQRHRLIGITDCDIIEVSTPEVGITWRLEDDYARPNETPEQRAADRGELAA